MRFLFNNIYSHIGFYFNRIY